MIHTIDKDKRYGGRNQRINTPTSMRKAEDYIKKDKTTDYKTGVITEKTKSELWYSSTGMVNEFARQCMTLQKQQGYIFMEGDKRLMVHQIQSFDSRDSVKSGGTLTPEKAHQIGINLVNQAYPNFQVLVVTHYNTKHIHNHFLINGVANPIQNKDKSFQKPHKFQDGNNAHRHENEYTIAEVKKIDQRLCKENELKYSATCYQNHKEKGIFMMENISGKTSILDSYKLLIDKALTLCKHFDIKDFKKILSNSFGVTIKIDNSRNSITYTQKTEDRIKKVSGAKLGTGYRLEDIHERLRSLKITANDPKGGTKSFGDDKCTSTETIRAELENRRTRKSSEGAKSGEPEIVSRELKNNRKDGRIEKKPHRI